MTELTISVVIPTYQREKVLIETLEYLLHYAKKTPEFLELILVDQTRQHEPETQKFLSEWKDQGAIKWFRLNQPHLTRSMNLGLLKARGDVVLFIDDDIIPNSNLLSEHLDAYRNKSDLWAVVGQISQPGEEPEDLPFIPSGNKLTRYLNFPFRRKEGTYIENAMAGNLSVKRNKALAIGGFDENFTPPVASRFETEFAKRLVSKGGKIWFEPKASIHHLQAKSGGTRAKGSHLNSISPRYGVGDCYYALRQGHFWESMWYILKRPFREVRTKYHLKHPWWIPVKFIGELRAIIRAIYLYRNGPKLIQALDYTERKRHD